MASPPYYSSYFITLHHSSRARESIPRHGGFSWGELWRGFGRFSETSSLISGGTNPGKSKTTGVLQAGFGLDVRIWRRISIRGDVRDFRSGEPDFPLAPKGKTRQHNFFAGGGAIWPF